MNQQSALKMNPQETCKLGDTEPVLFFVRELDTRLWGMTCRERLERAFRRNGIERVISSDELESWTGPVILLRGDSVLDAPLVPALRDTPGLVLAGSDLSRDVPIAAHLDAEEARQVARDLADDGEAERALLERASKPEDLKASYWKSLRKRETPYALVINDANMKRAQWRIFMGTYKGATDFITKYLWPYPAYLTTKLIAPYGITPNMVTAVSAVCVVAAYIYFLSGQWVLGLFCAWAMTFLDTVDGKLARVTLTSSKWGDVFDHGIDLVHPPFWYTAWALAVMASPYAYTPTAFWLILTIILVGYILQRIFEGVAIKYLGLEIHVWRPIDTYFRQITARRNPNLFIMTLAVIVGRPDWGLVAVAAWTLICLVLHGIQLIHAGIVKRRDGPLQSWLSRPQQ